MIKTVIGGIVGSVITGASGLLSLVSVTNAAAGIQTNNNVVPTMQDCIKTENSTQIPSGFKATYLGDKSKPQCGYFARVSCPEVLTNQLVGMKGGPRDFPGNADECRFELFGDWSDLSTSQVIKDWRIIQNGKLPDLPETETEMTFAEYLTYAAAAAGLLLILVGSCGAALGCSKKKRKPVPGTPMPQKPGSQWKKHLLEIGGGLATGALGVMLFLRYGGESAMAMSGLVSVATMTGANYRMNGNNNLGVGGGGNSLVAVNTLTDSSGTPENPTDKAWGAWGVMVNEQNKQLCMSKGMILRNPTDDAWIAWDSAAKGGKCLQDIPYQMINGICNSESQITPKASGAMNRTEFEQKEKEALAAALQAASNVGGEHSVQKRALLALVTPAEPDIASAMGRMGDQFDWPLKDGDYTTFNGLLLAGGTLLVRGLWNAATPVVQALADYINNDG